MDDHSRSGGDSTQVGIALLGIFFIVHGIAALGNNAIQLFKFDSESRNYVFADDLLFVATASFGSTLLLRLLPGALLLVFRERISKRLFPSVASSPSVSASRLYVLGCTLLSFYIFVSSAGGIVTGLVYFAVSGFDPASLVWETYISSFVASVIQFVLGVFLYQHAKRCAAAEEAGAA